MTRQAHSPSGTRRHRVAALGAAVGLSVGAVIGTLIVSGNDAQVDSPMNTAEPFEVVERGWGEAVDPVFELGQAHQQLLEVGGTLLIGEVVTIAVTDDRIDLTIRNGVPLWDHGPGVSQVAGSDVTVGARLGDPERSGLDRVPVPGSAVVVLVTSDGELLGLAAVTDDGNLESIDPVPDGPLFLGSAGATLAETGFPAIPGDHCGNRPPDAGTNAFEALRGYFEQLGATSREERIAALRQVDLEVERLVQAAPTMIDSVTGAFVPPAMNDIQRQVAAGVVDVTMRPTYPMTILLQKVDLETAAVLVFADSVTGQVTSWIDLAPTGWVDSAGVTHWNTELTAYIEAPAPGHDVDLLVRSIDDSQFDCARGVDEIPLLTIPYDLAFGSRRAVLDMASWSVTEMPKDRVPGS